MQYKAKKPGRFAHFVKSKITGKASVVFETAFNGGDVFEIPDIYPSKMLIEKGYADARV